MTGFVGRTGDIAIDIAMAVKRLDILLSPLHEAAKQYKGTSNPGTLYPLLKRRNSSQ